MHSILSSANQQVLQKCSSKKLFLDFGQRGLAYKLKGLFSDFASVKSIAFGRKNTKLFRFLSAFEEKPIKIRKFTFGKPNNRAN